MSIFDEHKEKIKRYAEAGVPAREIAEELGPGYEVNALQAYMRKKGIRKKQPTCEGCIHKAVFWNLSHERKIWICMRYRQQVKVNGQPTKVCVDRIKKEAKDAIQK